MLRNAQKRTAVEWNYETDMSERNEEQKRKFEVTSNMGFNLQIDLSVHHIRRPWYIFAISEMNFSLFNMCLFDELIS